MLSDTSSRKAYLSPRMLLGVDLSMLENVMAGRSNLMFVDLYDAQIADSGAVALARVLERNKSIETLMIGKNSIGNEGAIALAAALRRNASLRKLSLPQNEISDEGAIALANALEENSTLEILDLAANGITDKGALALANLRAKRPLLEVYGINLSPPRLERARKAVADILNERGRAGSLYPNRSESVIGR